MINDKLIDISKYFFKEILKKYNEEDIDLYLFGSSKSYFDQCNEIDFILIIPVDVTLTNICDEISIILFDAIQKFKKMITCFPVFRDDFNNKKNQFICNIEKEGINVKKFIE